MQCQAFWPLLGMLCSKSPSSETARAGARPQPPRDELLPVGEWSWRAQSSFNNAGYGRTALSIDMRGGAADETSSMSMSVSMSMSMLGTRPQRVGVFLLKYVGRSSPCCAFDLCGSPQRALLATPTRGADMHMVLVCKSRNSFSDALLPPTRTHRHTACRQKSAGSRNPAGRS